MKVLYIHQHFSTPAGAAGTRSYEMACALIDRGHHVTMLCGSYGGGRTGLASPFAGGRRRGVVEGIEIIEFDLAYANADGFAKRARTFLRFALGATGLAMRERYDVLFATSTPLTAAVPGVLARWLRGARFVFEVRDLWPELPKAMGVIRNPLVLWLLGVLEWVAYKSAHRLIGLSPGIVRGIARRGVPAARISMIPNGCDLALFGEPSEPWRPDPVQPGDLMAVFAGTHGQANGLDAVLDVAAELKRRGRDDIKIVLIGEGKRKLALQARALAESLHSVVFHDPVDKHKLAGLFASADVGLQILADVPAFYDGTSPNKLFDYLAAGLPVLINYPGWLADKVSTEDCGFAVSPGDAGAFADALIRGADDRASLRQMGARARALAVREFDRVELAARFVAVLEEAREKR